VAQLTLVVGKIATMVQLRRALRPFLLEARAKAKAAGRRTTNPDAVLHAFAMHRPEYSDRLSAEIFELGLKSVLVDILHDVWATEQRKRDRKIKPVPGAPTMTLTFGPNGATVERDEPARRPAAAAPAATAGDLDIPF
jgi:hypothetical protein